MTKREKELLATIYDNIQIMRTKRKRGADAQDEFQALTSVHYTTLWKWKNPPKKTGKKDTECGPDGLVEAAEEDGERGGFSDDDLFDHAPLRGGPD